MVLVLGVPMVEPTTARPSSPVYATTFFPPSANATGVELTSTGMLSIPANETFLTVVN
jgi:hypothetical protein